jgi:(1->4)-alpha-D-glucan 1-alpha-D-glucosylmutase
MATRAQATSAQIAQTARGWVFGNTLPRPRALPAPSATYRLQFRPGFGFNEARRLVPFLERLGITAIYASPVFAARSGSMHGYDVTDPSRLNPELGTPEEFDALAGEIKRRGMGLILDIVPNHMAACAQNRWWQDVLEDGPRSAFAKFFDIDWECSPPGCRGKIVLPVLGGPYGKVLENGELRLELDGSGLFVRYYEHRFPIALRSYRSVLAQRLEAFRCSPDAPRAGLAEFESLLAEFDDASAAGARMPRKDALKAKLWVLFSADEEIQAFLRANLDLCNGKPGNPKSFDLLDRILREQRYSLAFWRDAREDANYRKFFDIHSLIALRVEDEEVFGALHAFVFRLIEEGKVSGVRIDHIDGLLDPLGYLERLNRCLEAVTGKPRDFYVVAEKILLGDERLAADWPVCGTTGYDFLDQANAVFVDGAELGRLETLFARFTGIQESFDELVYLQKKRVAEQLFGGELRRLSSRLQALAAVDRYARDHDPHALLLLLREVTARLPVYRTYIRSLDVSPSDRRAIEVALKGASRGGELRGPMLDFLRRVLLLEFSDCAGAEGREAWLRFVMKWQQFTGPVMAKGMEDTACYIYNRLVSLNVVGGGSKPVSVKCFHEFNAARRDAWPLSFNATSTHDTKRSEDVRARINVLSELPDDWERWLANWSEWNRGGKQIVNGAPAPDANEEILIYQVLLGAWPLDEAEIPEFRERMKKFVVKAAREAKTHTDWLTPNTEYERALELFIERILEPGGCNRFLADFRGAIERIAPFGAIGSLAQVLLKIASPGLPDFYQGTLLWDFSLVDPDNRRPVDFERRIRALEQLQALEGSDPLPLAMKLAETWRDGHIKMWVIWKALRYRKSRMELFAEGEYIPLEVTGPARENLIAFARRRGEQWAIAAVPRLIASLCGERNPFAASAIWEGTEVRLPKHAPRVWHNLFTGEDVVPAGRGDGSRCISAAGLLARFPVSLLSGGEEEGKR